MTAQTKANAAPPLALYVHWPFCERKCPYCDFNSHVREQVDHDRWRRALLADMRHFAQQTPNHILHSIFFGGGTPSLMHPRTVAALIEEAAILWPTVDDLEITLEANPSSVEAARFAAYRTAGVNRVSLGVQALDDASLRFLGRLHTADEALRALEIARTTFDRLSFDLIYARPEQSLAQWREELTRALSFHAGHLSAYQLTIEQDTAFFRRHARGEFHLPDEDLAADLFALTEDLAEAQGLLPYEISNYAKPGAESRHNLAYWQAGHYVGIGPGAHGRLPLPEGAALATQQSKRPETWLDQVENKGHGSENTETVTADQRCEEAVMMGLRLTKGIDKALFAARLGRPLEQAVNPQAMADLIDLGMLCDSPTHLATTPDGRLLLNSLTSRLLS
ncbi:coproporphyrinogen III oxidase [Iodidimonas gelatinilytica]|uniref:Heme chaperone HemW n=1 Tax=Iodidimonas gelatinilytica TaxID=1236966 RepID=A0A5A7N1L9_9PROT|nr:radical SAM family heme chaperone HemW [Iodidimonas gelatinilytica]GER01625.1 coproporphyrinogen III oxidase [Iodidimonas gelatinilytica]